MAASSRHLLRIVLCIALLSVFSSTLLSADSRFFLRVGGGAAVPLLANLDDELTLQGNRNVPVGVSVGISLGRSLAENRWSLEAHFGAALFNEFDYTSAYDSFPARMRHFSYMAVVRRNFRPEGTLFKPSLGAGIGYGLTTLVSGGGKLGAAEALLTGRIDSSIRSNIDLSFECTYYTGLQKKEFKGPFLENVDTDVVLDSSGNPLEEAYRSLDIRLGCTFWLKQKVME
jgi:hypothetical protein